MTAANLDALVEHAAEVQRRLEAQGATEDAREVELIGVSGQAVKSRISGGILTGYQMGGRYVIPRSALDDYCAVAEASKGIEPLPDRDHIVQAVREGRRRFVWPAWRPKHERPH
ncbi:MAG TPA: hypothetical protein VFU88_13380 [Ktedonobacterales bacterium]|nr:hypothetical protein [Ktedonobacterales bacterium]